MTFFHSTKFYLCSYLANRLARDRAYTKEELERFILDTVDEATFEDPAMTVDHLRMEMIDRGFVVRNLDGTNYKLADRFVDPNESDEINLTRLEANALSAQQSGWYGCPFCRQEFKPNTFVRHYVRVHTHLRQVKKIQKFLKQL